MQRSEQMYYDAGIGVLRYGLVGLLLLWGSFKFFSFEAMAILPLLQHSPFFSWMLPVFGLRATSGIIGVIEIGTALLISSRHWAPRLSAYGSLAATVMFAVTLSFLVSTPRGFSTGSPLSGFLLKDIMFLGGALATAGEAFSADYERDLPPGPAVRAAYR